MAKVAILMGSKSDFEVVKPAVAVLKKFGVETEVRVISAIARPRRRIRLRPTREKTVLKRSSARRARPRIWGASSPLPRRCRHRAAVKTDMMGGLDSLLSIVQMPSGIPVAAVGVNGGENAGLLALQILGIKYPEIAEKLAEHKAAMREKINADDRALQEML